MKPTMLQTMPRFTLGLPACNARVSVCRAACGRRCGRATPALQAPDKGVAYPPIGSSTASGREGGWTAVAALVAGLGESPMGCPKGLG